MTASPLPGFEAASGQPALLLLVLAAVSLLPFAALTVTAFLKIAVVLSIARTALGTQQLPPTAVITGLSLVLAGVVMAPVGEAAHAAWLAEARETGVVERAGAAARPLKAFLLAHSDAGDRTRFAELAGELRAAGDAEAALATPADDAFAVLVPAFVISELREAFRIGFLIFLPFLVVDLVVSTVLLALGMHMLAPTTVSLPFKLLLFVAADGWQLLCESLLRGYLPA